MLVVCRLQCIDIIISSNATAINNAFVTYYTYGDNKRSTYISCTVTCTNCTRKWLLWTKEGKFVFTRSWIENEATGPDPDFVNKVKLVLDDEVNDRYVMEWKDTSIQDLPKGERSSEWACILEVRYPCPDVHDFQELKYFGE